jgi:hypothetical protein
MSRSKRKPPSSEIPEIPQELREEFAEGRVVLFLGAGVSMAADAPGWEELIQPLFDKMKLEVGLLRRLSLEQRVSFYLRRDGGRQELRKIFREELEQHRDLAAHMALISLPVSLILTTNYDPNLERAARTLRSSYEVILSDRDVPQKFQAKDLTIVHLYGNTEEFLASEEDLVNFERERPALSSILQHVLLTRTVFFLGFSFRDHNVLNHILRSHAMVRAENPIDHVRRHYAYIIDPEPSLLKDLWERRGLKILPSKPGETPQETSRIFLQFVHKLAQTVAEMSYDQKEREKMVCRVEQNHYWECIHERPEKPLMRRESTFSVLGLPESFKESGLDLLEGWELGLKRKRLYEKWMKDGTLKLLLNCQPRYWESVRGYKSHIALQRLIEIRKLVLSQLENPGLVFGIRRHPSARQSYASLGSSLLLHSDSPPAAGIPYKKSDIIRDRHAIEVFNQCFEREMEDLMRDAGALFGKEPGPDDIRKLKELSLETLDRLIAQLKGT